MNDLFFLNRHLTRTLGFALSVSLLLTGTLSPLAEANERNQNDTFWKTRHLTARRHASGYEQISGMTTIEDVGRRTHPLHDYSSKNWFEVHRYTPVFGPRSWRRGATLVPFVTIIQDAHDNYAAQLALSRTLAELAEKEKDGPLLVCVEGAWGPLSVDLSDTVPDPEKRKEISTHLLKRGLINGEEYLALTSDSRVLDIVGVDDPTLHKKNSRTRELVETWGASTQKRVQSLRSSLNILKRAIYPPSLAQLDFIERKYRQDKMSALQMARALRPLAPNQWWETTFPTMLKATLAHDEGNTTSPDQLEKKITDYLNSLPASAAALMVHEATQDLDHFIENFPGPSLLGKALNQIRAQRQWSLTAFSSEIEIAPRVLLNRLLDSENKNTKTSLSRRISEIDQWAILADRLVSLKMSPEDWANFNRSSLGTLEGAVHEMEDIARTAGVTLPPEPKIHPIHEKITWEAAKAFYRLAKSRDAALVTNTLMEARKRNKINVLLIAGGFHTPGMTQILKRNLTYNKTICPVFSLDPNSPTKKTLRKMSYFQTPESRDQLLKLSFGPEPDKGIRRQLPRISEWPSGSQLVRRLLLVGIVSILAITLTAMGVDPQFALATYTSLPLSNPFLQRMLDPKHDRPSPSQQLAQNTDKIESLKSAITAAIDGQNTTNAISILMDVNSYSDERAFSIFMELDDPHKKVLLDALEAPERARLFNGYFPKRYRDYLGDYKFLFEAMDHLKTISTYSETQDIHDAMANAKLAIQILESQINLIKDLPNVPNDLPMLLPSNELKDRTEYIDSTVRPFIEGRQKEITLWREILAHLEEKTNNPRAKNENLTNKIEETHNLYSRQYAGFNYFASGISSPSNDNWVRTLTRSGKRKDFRSFNDLSPSKGTRDSEMQRVNQLERLTERLDHGMEDLSERAQASLESEEGASWSAETSSYKTIIQQIRSKINPKSSDRSVAAVLPSRTDKRYFIDDLARTIRRNHQPLKTLYVDPLTIISSTPGEEKISTLLTTLLSEATARGDVLLVVDLDAFQNLKSDILLGFLKDWEKINDGPTPAPPLVLVCTERTHKIHLQQEKIRAVFPSVVSPGDSKKLARASLDRALDSLLERTGVTVSDGGLLDICLDRLAAMNPFDLVDRAVNIIDEAVGLVQGRRFRRQTDSLVIDATTMEGPLNKFPPFHLLPLRDRVIARARFMPESSRQEAMESLAEVEDLMATNPHSSSISSYVERLEGLIQFPWNERAPPLFPPDISEGERKIKIQELYQSIPKTLMKTHYGLDPVMDDLMDLVTKTVQSEIASAPGSMEIPTLVGPPGVGKTTLLKTLGKLTGRPVYLVSMNMVNDVVDIKGTHKTFLHSKGGLIALTLIAGDPNSVAEGGIPGVKNPIFILDEIDKSKPEVQNAILDFVGKESKEFEDNNYGKVPIDECLFVATANSLDPITSPLRNRMKIIYLPGYTVDQKTITGMRYTLPRVLKDLHIKDEVVFPDKAKLVQFIARGYAHEEGMRNMIRIIESVVSSANTQAIETGQPTVCDTNYVESIFGPPQFRPQIPDVDPLGEAYYPSQRGDINNVQAFEKKTREIEPAGLLSSRKPLNEMATHVEFLLRANRNTWAAGPDGIVLDVPRLGSDEAVAELAFVIASLSRMKGIPVRRETVFAGALDNGGNLLKEDNIRKRALTAFEAGARQLVLPSNDQNKDDLLSNTFASIPALRGPVLEKVEGEDQWRLSLPKSYSKSMSLTERKEDSFEILTGSLEEMRGRAESEAFNRSDGTRCLYILAGNVRDALPFAFAEENRPEFVLTHAPPPVVDDLVEEKGNPPDQVNKEKKKYPGHSSPAWKIKFLLGSPPATREVDMRNLFFLLDDNNWNFLVDKLLREIIFQITSADGSLNEDRLAETEALMRYAMASSQPRAGQLYDSINYANNEIYQGILSTLSPETIGNILFACRQRLIVKFAKDWTDNIELVKNYLDSLEKNPADPEALAKLKEILLKPEALPWIDEKGQVGDWTQMNTLLSEIGHDNPAEDNNNKIAPVISLTKKMVPNWQWAIDLFSPAGVSTGNSEKSEELFQQLLAASGGQRFEDFMKKLEGTMEADRVKTTWDVYAGAELLHDHERLDNIRYVSAPTSPWAPADPMEPVFGPAADRFTEVMTREDSRAMVLVGCPPLLKSEWPPYLLSRLWDEGRPSRMIKLDVSKILNMGGEQTLLNILSAAHISGDTAVWIDLDELPDDLDHSMISVALHILSQGPRATPLLFTGSESAHLKWLGQSPAYARQVVPLSMVDADPGSLLSLEILHRNRTTGFSIEKSAADSLVDSIKKNETSLSLARRILDRSLEFSGDAEVTIDHLAQARQEIALEDEKNIFQATLRERYELISVHMTAEARRTCQNLLSRLQTASRNEAGTIEKMLKYIIHFPWNKRSKPTITRLSTDPTPEQVANLKKEIQAGIANLRKVLDETHFGMNGVKNRIVDYYVRNSISLAYTGRGIGKPILLVSDPGIGKSSIAPSVAKGLGRAFARLALGAVRDFRELIGFNSAYEKADAGKFIKSMKERDTVFLLDEIDKMTEGPSNNPFQALLSFVDPSQNNSVLDNFTGVRFPFDECLFIGTANTLKPIPEPLLDRFEVIRVPAYDTEEKVAIGSRYAFPELEREWASDAYVRVTDPAGVVRILLGFVKEQGVRQLKIFTSLVIGRAVTMAHKTGKVFDLTAESAATLLKKHAVKAEDRPLLAVGRINGLAVRDASKEGLLFRIQADMFDTGGKDPFQHSEVGQLGESMRPSFSRAMAYAKSRVDQDKLLGQEFSLFMGPIDIGKDGDSAGAPLGFAILSAFTDIPIRQDVAMTGMIDAKGRIDAVGAIEGKVTAAINEGMREIFVPAANKKDLFNDVILNNGTTSSLFIDVTDPEKSAEIRIPKTIWPRAPLDDAKNQLKELASAAGLEIKFQGETALLTGTETQANAFFQSNKNFRKPTALIIYSHMAQIEDRVMAVPLNPPSMGKKKDIEGSFAVPFIISLLGITALALGIPVWVGLDTLLPWITAHAWTIGFTTPILVLSLLTPFIVARTMARTTGQTTPTNPSVDEKGGLQLPSDFQWKLLVELNGMTDTTTNEDIRMAIKEIVTRIDASTPLSAKDPLWETLLPYLQRGPASARTALANLLVQANPTLTQYELLPPAPQASLIPKLDIGSTINSQS